MAKTPMVAPVKAAPRRFCGKAGCSGPAKGNGNAIRHGLKSGKLPRDARYIEYQMNGLRRILEAAVMAARSEVTIPDAAAIQTAVKWERHGALCLRWLRVEGEKLKPEQKMTFSREIARASAERDKAIAALRLDRDARDGVIDALYARLPAPGKGTDEPA